MQITELIESAVVHVSCYRSSRQVPVQNTHFCFSFMMVSAKCADPPSARSNGVRRGQQQGQRRISIPISYILCSFLIDTPLPALLTITIHRCQNDIVQAPAGNGLGRILRLMDIQGLGCLASLHGAESASTRAFVSHKLLQR